MTDILCSHLRVDALLLSRAVFALRLAVAEWRPALWRRRIQVRAELLWKVGWMPLATKLKPPAGRPPNDQLVLS